MLEWFQGIEITLSDFKDISEIIFAMVGVFVASKAYLAAKKTVLSPLKTEVLKLQLEAIKEVHQYITVDDPKIQTIDDLLDIWPMWILNVQYLYATWFLVYSRAHIEAGDPHEFSEEELLGIRSELDINNLSFISSRKNENDAFIVDNWAYKSHKLEEWKKAKVQGAYITDKFKKYSEGCLVFYHSPWLPQDLLKLIEEYEEALITIPDKIQDGIEKIKAEVLNEATFDSSQKAANFYSFQNTHSDILNMLDLEAPFKKIVEIHDYIREYLKVNDLMD